MKQLVILFSLSCLIISTQAQTAASSEVQVMTYVERMPEPGFEIYKFLGSHIKYPPQAIKDDVQGRTVISFIVNETGELSDFKVVKSLSPECDEEAIRVLKEMPKWKPGMQGGKPVKVLFTLPIVFKLE